MCFISNFAKGEKGFNNNNNFDSRFDFLLHYSNSSHILGYMQNGMQQSIVGHVQLNGVVHGSIYSTQAEPVTINQITVFSTQDR